jgi:hypothetical protein
MTLDPQWRTLARQLIEPYAQQLVEGVGTARREGWTDDQVDEVLRYFAAKMRAEYAPVFTAAMIELLIAEIMDSYRKQLNPPSRAVQ